MAVLVTGNLVDPMAVAIEGAIVRVIAANNEVSLLGMEASSKTLAGGVYSFNLVEGIHDIEVMFNDEYLMQGQVLVDVSTPSPITLVALLNNHLA